MNHYKIHKPEPIDLILRYNLNFIEGNIVKYVLRSPFKGDSTADLKKALVYSEYLQDIGFYREFDDCELDSYTELNDIEKDIVSAVIRNDVVCMSGYNYVENQLRIAILERELKDMKNVLLSRLQNETT